jgi:DNA polymerase I-like protein with 3'-5' exonuclease and polymerase domains
MTGGVAEAVGQRRLERLPSGESVWVTETDGAGTPRMIEQQMAVGRKNGRAVTLAIRQFYVCRDSEVQHYLDWLETLPRDGRGRRQLGWDTETSGIHWRKEKIATEQFGNPFADDPRAYTFDVRCLSAAALARVMAPVDDPSFVKLVQHGKFECLYAMHHLGARPTMLIDTQVAELVIRTGLLPGGDGDGGGDGQDRRAYGACSMKKLVERRCGGLDIDKDHDLRVSFYVTPPGQHSVRQVLYAGSDTIHPFYIWRDQQRDVDARALRSVLAVEFELIPVLAEMEIAGMAFDSEAWITLWQEAVEQQDRIERRLDAMFLVVQGDLFNGTLVDDSPSRPCTICGGSGKRQGRGECDYCGGTGRTRGQGVRPLYTAGKGKNAKPRPLNWGSSAQVKWALRQYCAAVAWPITLVTTEKELLDLKRRLGVEWLRRRKLIGFDEEGRLLDAAGKPLAAIPDELAEQVPDYVIPEETHCLLLSADHKDLTLRKIRGQLPKDFVELILDYSETKAKLGTFGIDFLKNVHDDGRVRFEFHQAVTATGRLSASPNGMNIPRDERYRACFRAGKGKKLCIADYSQQEPRLSAVVSQDELYLRNYRNGDDLYVVLTEEMVGYRPDVHAEDEEFRKKSKKDRQSTKSTALGLGYRMGKGKLRDKLTYDLGEPVTFEAASQQHDAYLSRCPGIKTFQELCFEKANPESETAVRIWDEYLGQAVTFIESPCGRKRFFAPDSLSVYTEACNFPIQAAGATMTKSAMCLITREIRRRGWAGRAYIVNAIHDELVVEADADIAPEVAVMMKEEMERSGSHYLRGVVPAIADFATTDGTADCWVKG